MDVGEAAREQEAVMKLQLKEGLASLPVPRNDFQIVLPEAEGATESEMGEDPEQGIPDTFIEDQAELDERMRDIKLQELEELLARQSQALQRELPRPLSVNKSILRGQIHADQRYKELYEAEELMKEEMLHMISYDLVNFSPDGMSKQLKVSLYFNKELQTLY